MNNEFVSNFIKTAQEKGLTKQQAEKFISGKFNIKSAEQIVTEFSDSILKEAGVEKTAHAQAYVESMVKAAQEKGLTTEAIKQVVKHAIYVARPNHPKIFKSATLTQEQKDSNQKMAAYVDGFLATATSKGINKTAAMNLLIKAADAQGGDMQAQLMQFLQQQGGGQGGGQQGGPDLGSLMGGGQGAAQGGGQPGGGMDIQALLALLSQAQGGQPGGGAPGQDPSGGGMFSQPGA